MAFLPEQGQFPERTCPAGKYSAVDNSGTRYIKYMSE
jgi:hypothetical protein